jgi:hypothetical protein
MFLEGLWRPEYTEPRTAAFRNMTRTHNRMRNLQLGHTWGALTDIGDAVAYFMIQVHFLHHILGFIQLCFYFFSRDTKLVQDYEQPVSHSWSCCVRVRVVGRCGGGGMWWKYRKSHSPLRFFSLVLNIWRLEKAVARSSPSAETNKIKPFCLSLSLSLHATGKDAGRRLWNLH